MRDPWRPLSRVRRSREEGRAAALRVSQRPEGLHGGVARGGRERACQESHSPEVTRSRVSKCWAELSRVQRPEAGAGGTSSPGP